MIIRNRLVHAVFTLALASIKTVDPLPRQDSDNIIQGKFKSIIVAKLVPDPTDVPSIPMSLDCEPVGVEWQKLTIWSHSRIDAGSSPTAAAAGWLMMSSLVISRRRGDTRIVARGSLGGDSLGVDSLCRMAGNGASVFAQPFFNFHTLQIGVAIRAEILVYLGDGNTGVEMCAGEVDGVGINDRVVVIRHVDKDFGNVLLQDGVWFLVLLWRALWIDFVWMLVGSAGDGSNEKKLITV